MLDFTQKIINISHIKNIKINQKIQKNSSMPCYMRYKQKTKEMR